MWMMELRRPQTPRQPERRSPHALQILYPNRSWSGKGTGRSTSGCSTPFDDTRFAKKPKISSMKRNGQSGMELQVRFSESSRALLTSQLEYSERMYHENEI